MKTFEQFLSEAGAYGMDRRANQTFFATGGAASAHKPGRLVTQRAEAEREEQNKERERKGLPQGTTASFAKRDIQRQTEAEQAAQTAEQQKKDQMVKAAELLAAQKQNPEYQAKLKKAEQARKRSAQRAARKAQNS